MSTKKSVYQGSGASEAERAEVASVIVKISEMVYRAQYKKAFHLAASLRRDYPKNRFAIFEYAVTLGDCSEWASEKQAKKNAIIAASILKSLLKRTSGIDPRWVRVWRNEYYWFSKQPLKQYLLGSNKVKAGDPRGNYSAGVGAASLSCNLVAQGKLVRGAKWARKSVGAWENYFKVVPNYYNAYVWYARALGLSGDLPGMEKALKKAAKLSGRPLSYQEFVRARKQVMDALAAGSKSKPKTKTKPKSKRK